MPGVIKINPDVMNDKRDALAVAVNEALRLFMEDTGFTPVFDVTPEQLEFFKNTAYHPDNAAQGTDQDAAKGGDVLGRLDPATWGGSDGRVSVRAEEPAEAERRETRAKSVAEQAAEAAIRKRAFDEAGNAVANAAAGYLPRRVTDTAEALGESVLRAAADLAPGPESRAALLRLGARGKAGTRQIGDSLSRLADKKFPRNKFSGAAEMATDTAVGVVAPWAVDLATSVPQAMGVAGQRGEDKAIAGVSQLTGTVIGRGRDGGLVQDVVPAVSRRLIRPIPRVGKAIDMAVQAGSRAYGETIEGLISEPVEKRAQDLAESLKRAREWSRGVNSPNGGTP
jgi:hypothetical protein